MPEPGKPTEPISDQLTDAARRIEDELKRVVQYIDEKVVPEVRVHSSNALRAASERLSALAEHLDESRKPRP